MVIVGRDAFLCPASRPKREQGRVRISIYRQQSLHFRLDESNCIQHSQKSLLAASLNHLLSRYYISGVKYSNRPVNRAQSTAPDERNNCILGGSWNSADTLVFSGNQS
jgi:hypothetical protein